jgi:hypothetical protein
MSKLALGMLLLAVAWFAWIVAAFYVAHMRQLPTAAGMVRAACTAPAPEPAPGRPLMRRDRWERGIVKPSEDRGIA